MQTAVGVVDGDVEVCQMCVALGIEEDVVGFDVTGRIRDQKKEREKIAVSLRI